MDKQFDRLEKAIEKGDYKTSTNNVKYIKKGIAVIKQNDPNLDLRKIESRLKNLENQIGPDPLITKEAAEKKLAATKKANYEKERNTTLDAQRKEQRERELAYAKQLKSQGADISRNAMGKSGPDVKLDFNSSRVGLV